MRRTQLAVERVYEDVEQPRFGEPELFRVLQTRQPGTSGTPEVLVHESRLLFFRGVMTARSQAPSGQYWDDSVLQRVHEAMRASSSSWMSAAHLMTDASQGVLKIANLMQLLSTSGEPLLRKRMQMMDIARSVCRSILIDAEKEEFTRVTTSFSGVPELLDRFMMRVAAAANMPVTILFGRSPAGMNATGESDTRGWYDTVQAERAEALLPKLEALVRLVMATDNGPTRGQVLEGWQITFPSLWQETAAEQANVFKTKCDALVAVVGAQIALPEEAALKLAHDGHFVELDVDAREKADAFVSEQLELVHGLTEQTLAQTHAAVLEGLRQGLRPDAIAKNLREKVKLSESKATILANDQVGKLNGELTQLRQRALGIKRYKWATSRDELVRPGHRALDGTIHKWSEPPVVNAKTGKRAHPGFDSHFYPCRCSAIPVLDDLLEEAGLRPVTVPPQPPANEPILPPVPAALPRRRAANVPPSGSGGRDGPPRGGGGGGGEPPGGEPPSGAPGAGPLVDAPRPTRALVRRSAKLKTHDVDYYDRHPDRELTPAQTLVFVSGPVVQLIDNLESRKKYADWMGQWIGTGSSSAKLGAIARRGIAREGSASQDGYLATQAFIEARLSKLRREGVMDRHGFVTLYRGVYGGSAREIRAAAKPGGVARLYVNEAASWTEHLRVARAAARMGDDGVVVKQKIHYTRVFSTHRANGYDWAVGREAEWTVLHDDGTIDAEIVELLK